MNKFLRILPFLILPGVAVYMLARLFTWQITLAYFLLISITTFGSYWQDKRRAQKDLWRIPEKSLHTFELLGGWPAAYLAQEVFRHKTQKGSYRIVFWCIVALYQFLAFEMITGWRISQWFLSLV